ncbi:MAG TPA: DUF5916 domain-containing protein, partial [Candidatus Eisenbacteria bacterium]
MLAFLLAVPFTLLPMAVAASQPDSAAVPAIEAAPLEGAIRIDGRLDEPAWRGAPPVTRFTQRDPREGERASEPTEVRILIGDDALDIGARLYDHEPERIRARLVRRDDDLDSDYFAVFLDSYHDRLTSWVFRVNPLGCINDGAVDAGGNEDLSWDAVWQTATSRDSLGWTVEIEIPLSQLHYSTKGDGRWGIQLRRRIYRKQELAEFSFVPKTEQYSAARYGVLTGLAHLRAPRHLEILPYTRLRSEFRRVPAGDPFRDGADQFPAAGLDVRYGLTSNLTLNATMNPDFGEVEVDPAVVNLSAFETFYPEKRPFFVEGAEVFRFGATSSYNNFNTTIPFHARRIGAPPHGAPDGAGIAFVDSPDRTTIAGAAKVTGKTRGGVTLGILEAVTARETCRYTDTLGVQRTAPAEPLTNYLVGRFRSDLHGGNTVVGGLLTAVDRDLPDTALRDLLRAHAQVGGLDLNHYWAGRRWSLDANVLVSTIRGSRGAIAAAQRSSARYYQRPDAEYLRFDPTRTSLTGAAGLLSLNKTAGKHWRGSLTYQDWSPGFEINDLGFQNAADSRGASSLLLYTENRPGRIFRYFTLFTFSNASWNYGGNQTFSGHALHAEGQLLNYWSGYVRTTWYPGSMDDRLTRGGPLSRFPAGGNVSLHLDSDTRKSTTFGLTAKAAWDEAGGIIHSITPYLALRPASSVRISFEPGLQRTRDNAQYVTVVEDPLAVRTYGSRYVFATLDQTSLNLDTRVDWTFSPRLSLQVYAQPLVVSADYFDVKELRAPGTYEFDVYGRTRGSIAADTGGGYLVDPDGAGPAGAFPLRGPDFNYRSLLGNAVLRWEYRPGSTVYVVWQQKRETVAPVGDFAVSR